MTTEIFVFRGVPTPTALAFFGVICVESRPGFPLTVRLVVDDGEERKYTLEPDDTFSVRGEPWKLDHVDDPAGDWQVCFRKVE
ncbi:DUF6406 domain-containing protein [Streptomyces sp. NPDC054854]